MGSLKMAASAVITRSMDSILSWNSEGLSNISSSSLRVSSEAWIEPLKREISRLESLTPSIFDEPKEEDIAPKKQSNAMGQDSEQVPDESVKELDILSSQGEKLNHHPGNKRFRQVVDEMKSQYKTINAKLIEAIVDYVVKGYGGRFLTRKNAKPGCYRVMTTEESRKKTSEEISQPEKPALGIVDTIMALIEKNKAEEAIRKKEKTKKPKKPSSIYRRYNRKPTEEMYVDRPTSRDVLLGRGSRSNYHRGNIHYLNRVEHLRDRYRSTENRNAKTDLSQKLVDWVQKEQGGRFLKLDKSCNRWYVVPNDESRRKAGQALREHMTKEEREAQKAGTAK